MLRTQHTPNSPGRNRRNTQLKTLPMNKVSSRVSARAEVTQPGIRGSVFKSSMWVCRVNVMPGAHFITALFATEQCSNRRTARLVVMSNNLALLDAKRDTQVYVENEPEIELRGAKPVFASSGQRERLALLRSLKPAILCYRR